MKASNAAAAPIEIAEFNNVIFPSFPEERFRITCEPLNNSNRWNLWLENRRTKLQYELSVISLKSHGPDGVPAPIVCSLLLKALSICEGSNDEEDEEGEDVKKKADDLKLDCTYSAEGITIDLTLNMSSLWLPVYSFTLAKKDVNEVEIIKSQLKDALEEIKKLKSKSKDAMEEIEELRRESGGELKDIRELKKKPAVLSLSSASTAGHQKIVQWNAPGNRIINSDYFTIDSSTSNISILKKGWYQVCVRLAGTSNSNGSAPVTLLLNGVALASCVQSDANGYQNSAHLSQIFEFDFGAILCVRAGFPQSSLADPTQNNFSISLL
mmetsp:Transcript_25799/g.24643  ORF Transcript_25799/g.24643 Transcript_25799/m.24643 type:complete len:325 (-) Transcript_25799:372-1346(-)|eukprot:CAMPEP_0119039408 /NCGR_PEP_ID=MMETSP1177-20130426/8858_1 /TAXON_ID=2985 /ORGANISM="Ochromonas sp, Strain CCMP1899" /LENGTH=324 /DNA_ID=CAMNT_0007003221 /DNA_START=121 /DNA_END=1095 /DNA_ORIENTATION=-